MANLQALREHKQELAKQANNLIANAGDKVWTKDEQAKYDGVMDEMERLSNQINSIQKLQDAEADTHFKGVPASKMASENDVMNIVSLYLRNGSNVTPEQAIQIRNAMSTTTTTEGGYTVPAEVATLVINALKAYGGLRSVSTILTTATGNTLSFPTSDGTAEVGELVAENTAASAGDITFGTAAVTPYKYSSKKIALPWELINDSAIDVVAFVVERLAERLGRATNLHYTNGTGSSQPFGITARAASGKVGTTGQTLSVIYDDLVDLFYSVNSEYRKSNKSAFMLADSSLKVVRKLKDGQSRPIFVPSFEGSLSGSTPDTIMGKPVIVNDDMPVMAANAKPIVFGDFSKFYIRDVAGLILRRFDDSGFALNGQVGFCGWLRSGSNLLDTAAVKYYQNSAT